MEAPTEDENAEVAGGEDIPSDFFDEFNKDEFIEGLSIIDSWDEEQRNSKNSGGSKKEDAEECDDRSKQKEKLNRRYSQLDEFIKPGSRRDPSKTNEAIKKDKEVKVKEYLAKSLESAEDLRPPGTELDDYYDENKTAKKDPASRPAEKYQEPVYAEPSRSRSRERRWRESPGRNMHRPPRWSPRRSPYRPHHRSPIRLHRPTFQRQFSPPRHYLANRKDGQRRSPRRSSPRRSPRHYRSRRSRSRSPYKRSYAPYKRSKSRSPKRPRDNFLYPKDSDLPPNYTRSPSLNVGPSPMDMPYAMGRGPYPGPPPMDYSGGPGYQYNSAYSGGYSGSYDYGMPPVQAGGMSSQSVTGMTPGPITVPNPVVAPVLAPTVPVPGPVPAPVPASTLVSSEIPMSVDHGSVKTPYDALAKLVAEGKISKEDYLKLAPNKGASSTVENRSRVLVLNRCSSALSKLAKLHLPNRLLMNNAVLEVQSNEPKCLAPKFCSPLKRQTPVEFLFTKDSASATSQQNKHLINSIIAAMPSLEKLVSWPKKKTPKNTRDVAVQTFKPYCDACEIRDSVQFADAETSVDPEHFGCAVHTQVVEQDLINSKAVFTPSGSVGDGAPMSIAHLTPAQLVSQLAARAKTLKQHDASPPNQFRRNPNNYDYDERGGQQYPKYNNFRY